MNEQAKLDLLRAEIARLMAQCDRDGFPEHAAKLADALEVIEFCYEPKK